MKNTKSNKILEAAQNDFLREIDSTNDLVTQLHNANYETRGLSSYLGNQGKYCTLTVECMPSCN